MPKLKFYTQNHHLEKINELDLNEKESSIFFPPPNKYSTNIKLSNLFILPAETIKKLAHKLNVSAARVYADITDGKNRDAAVKFMKFLDAISPDLRIKLQGKGISNYRIAFKRIQELHEIFQNEKFFHAIPVANTEKNFVDKLR